MNLKKWYMDFVSDDGQAALCYAAQLRYKGLSLGYSALVNGKYGEPFTAQYSLRAFSPQMKHSALQWCAPKWQTELAWQTDEMETVQAPLALWQSGDGAVIWHNLIPGSQAVMQQDKQTISGMGYVEQLALNIFPWELPIKRLRWGRFVSSGVTLVWIEWRMRDGSTRQWLTFNKQAVEVFYIDDKNVASSHGELCIERGSPIREGYLKDTAFSSIAFLKWFLPDEVLKIHEYKQLAPASFYFSDDFSDRVELQGWVIDEIVDFP